MPPAVTELDAIVLRTLKYGEADVIAHLFTREAGRRNAIAKGARRPKSRLGARLEPFLAVRVQLREGRGDLGIVQSVEVEAAHDGLRTQYRLQRIAAVALDMLGQLSVEHAANEPAYHLTRNLLQLLDGVGTDEVRASALLTGYELKLLHLTGLAPHLGSCARCGASGPLVAWSAPDGGVVCASCREPVDAPLDADAWAAAVHAMQAPLAELARPPADAVAPPTLAALRAARRRFVDDMCAEHAGFRPRER